MGKPPIKKRNNRQLMVNTTDAARFFLFHQHFKQNHVPSDNHDLGGYNPFIQKIKLLTRYGIMLL